jgi:hypothetical protein
LPPRSLMSVPREAVDLLLAVATPALELFPRDYLVGLRTDFRRRGLQRAVREHDTAALFDWLMDLAAQQGISDRNAYAFIDRHGNVGWRDIEAALASRPSCGRLRCYWSFHNCGYRKGTGTCAAPALLHPARCPCMTSGRAGSIRPPIPYSCSCVTCVTATSSAGSTLALQLPILALQSTGAGV